MSLIKLFLAGTISNSWNLPLIVHGKVGKIPGPGREDSRKLK
jgi:hypothetical protein